MKSRSPRVWRNPKGQSVYLPVQSLNILYPTAALLRDGPDALWMSRFATISPPNSGNQSSLRSSWQHSITLRIPSSVEDYHPQGLDSVATNLQEAAESQKGARTGQSTSTLSCSSCWPPCVLHGLTAPWCPGLVPCLALKGHSRSICWTEKNLFLSLPLSRAL